MLIREVLDIFRRWLWLVVIGVTIAALLGFIQSRRTALTYEAVAGVVVMRSNFEVKLEPRFVSTTDNPLAADQRQTDGLLTLAAVAANRSIAGPVFDDLKGQYPDLRDPADLVNRISAQVLNGVIQIKATADEPKFAALLADTWAVRYADYVNRLYAGNSTETDLATQVADGKVRYEKAEAALIDFNRTTDFDQTQVQITEKQAMLNEVLQVRRYGLTGELESLKTRRSQIEELLTNAKLLRALLNSGQSSAASVANTLGLISIQLAAVEQVPTLAGGGVTTGTVGSGQNTLQFSFNPQRLDEVTTPPEQLRSDLDNLTRVLEGQVTAYDKRLTALQDTIIQESGIEDDPLVSSLLVDLRSLRAHLEELRSQRQQLEQQRDLLWSSYGVLASGAEQTQVTSSASDGGVVRFAIPAKVPGRPTGVGSLQYAIFAAILGFMIMAVAIFIFEFLDDKVRRRQDVEEVLGLPVIALIPKGAPVRGGSRLPGVGSSPPALEAARSVRARLEALDGAPRSFVFTGMKPGDGNTTVVSNVGVVMAQSGRTVVLIDANMRSPRLHELFDLPNHQGLTTLLADDSASLEAVLQPTGISRLRVLTSGPTDMYSADLLNTPRVAAILAAIRDLADVVLVDVAAIGAVTDAMSLVEHVDRVIFVIRSGASSVSTVEHARDGISAANGQLVGVVLNRSPEGRTAYPKSSGSSESPQVAPS